MGDVLITAVTMTVADLDEADRFYAHALGLPTARHAGALTVRVGSSRLRLTSDPVARHDHVAFTIPVEAFAAAKAWLRDRVPLLARDGTDEFDGPPGWDSRSLYFPGPSDSILELIARSRLPSRGWRGPFTGADLLAVSEVGLTVDNVPAAVQYLQQHAGLAPFAGTLTDDFAALGNDDGLVILAQDGRTWFPTNDRAATPTAVTITAIDQYGTALRIQHDELSHLAGSTSPAQEN